MKDFIITEYFEELISRNNANPGNAKVFKRIKRRLASIMNEISMNKILDIDDVIINDFERMKLVDHYHQLQVVVDYDSFLKKAKILSAQIKRYEEKANTLRYFGQRKELKRQKETRKRFFESNIERKSSDATLDAIQALKDTRVQQVIYDNHLISQKDKSGDGMKYSQWVELALAIQQVNEQEDIDSFAKDDLTNINGDTASIDSKTKTILDVIQHFSKEIHSMQEVKRKLVCILNQKLESWNDCSVLGLHGPPGIGKTTLFEVIAKVLDIPCTFISMAGITDPHYLTGHSFTYVGSQPGIIAKTLIQNKKKRQIIFLDEVDKITNTNVKNILISLLDPQQNSQFTDQYFQGLHLDLSNTWFILTMNDQSILGPILRNRIEMIDVDGYGEKDKKIILKSYIAPKMLTNLNMTLDEKQIDDAVNLVMRRTQKEEGVRMVKAKLNDYLLQLKLKKQVTLSHDTLQERLTPLLADPQNKYLKDICVKEDEELVKNDCVYVPSLYI